MRKYRIGIPLFIVALGAFFLIRAVSFSSGGLWSSTLSPTESSAPSPSVQPLSSSRGTLALNRCSQASKFYVPDDTRFCSNVPKLDRFRLFEINLSDNRILFYEQGVLSRTFPIAYQSAYGKWFQTPTGYFTTGVKKPKFMSSIVPVYMEDAVQFYEDFFIHGIPYYADGTRVTSQFSGGCLRLEDTVAKEFYSIAQRGDDVVSYATLTNLSVREGFASPVYKDAYWIRQRYNSPLKVDFTYHADNRENYIQHTGLDLAPLPGTTDMGVYAIASGVVEQIILNGQGDRGLGNTLMLRHEKDGELLYSLYGHLSEIGKLSVGQSIEKGQRIGTVGNTGYGCNYWRVGKDGCTETGEYDTHLHLEVKTKPVLDAPIADPSCWISKDIHSCVGSTSEDPGKFGYIDPMYFVFEDQHGT